MGEPDMVDVWKAIERQGEVPGYLVITQQDQTLGMALGISISHIMKVIPCDLLHYKEIWDAVMGPYQAMPGYTGIEGRFYAREADNVIRDKAREEAGGDG